MTEFVDLNFPQSGIGVITLNAPPANTLSVAMMKALSGALTELAAKGDIKCVVLKATGKIFCAGHDLKELTAARDDADGGVAFFSATMNRCAELMQQIVRHPKPIIAEVDGLATAAGCQLVASCDLAIASNKASFCTPGVNIGLFCSTPMVALSRNLSRKHAMEMLLKGEAASADDAVRMGLINKVVHPEELGREVLDWAKLIASKSSSTIKIGKQAFYDQAEMNLSDAYIHCARVMVENMMTEDAQEGIGAVLEKRQPVWKD